MPKLPLVPGEDPGPDDELHVPRLILNGHEHRPLQAPGMLPGHGPAPPPAPFDPQAMHRCRRQRRTSGPRVGLTNSITCPPGIDAHDGVLPGHPLVGGEVGKLGTLSPVDRGSALCPFLGGRTGRPASHNASLRLAATPSKAPAITRECTVWGRSPVLRTRSPAPV